MNATDPSFANILQIHGNLEHYHVPKYQREYTWGKGEWEQLLSDIEENNVGYFMGSIICIDDNSELGPGESRIYEVVDGQQRLTTLSLLLMSIYRKYKELESQFDENVDEEELEEHKLRINSIRKQLILKKNETNRTESGYFMEGTKHCFLRVQPSSQRENFKDYLHILNELGLLKGDFNSKFCGLRRIYKAFDFFYHQLPDPIEELNALVHKINSLKFVHISVSSSSDAFTLFESLNNRGVPLSVMDIIKNKMLASLEKQSNTDIDIAYNEWQSLLKYLPEYQDQERFLRQYYNAFKVYPEKRLDKFPKATKSSLVKIYEQFIKKDAQKIFDDLQNKAIIYNKFIYPDLQNGSKESNYLMDLQRIGSAPSYTLLIYLYSLEPGQFEGRKEAIDDILDFLTKYYIRRNITDFPNTRDLDSINMEVIENCEDHLKSGNRLNADNIIDSMSKGKGIPADLNQFKASLQDNIFRHNSNMARYVLTKLDEISHSREYKPQLWQRNDKGLLVWTIEHIFPQGSNIPKVWVDMVANGDRAKAEEIHENWVHCLGNLTLSGYNSQLYNASFEKKQDLHEKRKFLGHEINIGYKNNLALNNLEFEINGSKTSLSKIATWTEDSIIARNKKMVKLLLELFAFNQDEFQTIDEH